MSQPHRLAPPLGALVSAHWQRWHIPGSLNFPLDDLRGQRSESASAVAPGAEVIVYCQVGQRAHPAGHILQSWGCRVANLDGGYLTWSDGARARGLGTRPSGTSDPGHGGAKCSPPVHIHQGVYLATPESRTGPKKGPTKT